MHYNIHNPLHLIILLLVLIIIAGITYHYRYTQRVKEGKLYGIAYYALIRAEYFIEQMELRKNFDRGQLVKAAICYADNAESFNTNNPPAGWPWGDDRWKILDRQDQLSEAIAYLLAESYRIKYGIEPGGRNVLRHVYNGCKSYYHKTGNTK